MSAAETPRQTAGGEGPKRSLAGRLTRRGVKIFAWVAGSLVLLLVLLVAGVSWYTTTADFDRRVRTELVSVLEDSTGGRVELGAIKLNLWHLAVEIDGLIIRGLEGPGEAPYLSADRILIRAKINTVISHTLGKGAQSRIGLNYLRVEQPQVHLIIDKDGKTNQPVPKKPSTSTTPIQNTLLDLQAEKVELANGLALVNDRAIPFDVAARALQAEVRYLSSSDRYGATIDLNDLRTRMAKEPEAQSRLHLEAELGRDAAELKVLDLHTGERSELKAAGSILHFNHPEYQASIDGDLELKQIAVLGGVQGLNSGSVELHLKGHNCYTEPAEAQKKPRFWQRHHPADAARPSTKVLPPDPDCTAGYLVVGEVKLHNAGYRDANVRLHDINGGAQLHVTPTELLLTALTGYLPGGGSATGELRVSNWLGEVPPSAPAQSPTTVAAAKTANTTARGLGAKQPVDTVTITPVNRAHALLNVTINRIALRTIMAIAAPATTGDLGFDTAFSGPVKAEWGGPATEIADTVNVDADVKLAPTGSAYRGRSIPLRGEIVAHYRGATQVVNIDRATVQTPGSTLDASGVLGVAKGDPLTALRADLTVRDLAEYDQLLTTLGVSANGKKGAAALPVALHGGLQFQGTARGPLANLDVKGHLQATDFALKMGTQADVHIDSVIADAEYAPRTGLAVASSTIRRGSAVLNAGGTLLPHRTVSRRGVVTYKIDDESAVSAKVQLNDAALADVLEIAGQKDKIPVTGTLAVNGQVGGTLGALTGGGEVRLVNGEAYGERFDSALVDLNVQGKQVEASQLLLKLHGMQISGNGGYNLASEQFHGYLEGNNLLLSKFDTVAKQNLPVDGLLNLQADARGTATEPGLQARFGLTKVTYNGQQLGELTAEAHSQGKTAYLMLNSTLVGAQVAANATTQLVGDYDTQARLTLRGLDIAKPMALLSASPGMKVSSRIDGVVTVDGPLKTPKALSGMAELNPLEATLQGVQLKAEGPLRVSLRNGVATLEALHIVGQDTDLRASGSAEVLGVTDPKGGRLDVNASGSINTAVAHTFDPDVLTKGKVEFKIAAAGKVKDPLLTGTVDFEHVDAAYEGIPNGLTNLNGQLAFNDNRLEVKSLTATTGGGLLTFGGFVMYRGGLYADLSVTAQKVRVRYNGLSTTADANIKLQGSDQGALLSGSLLITRFNVGADVDFAAFAGTGGVSAPPDPNALTNKIRMDVHVTSSPQLDFQNSYAKLAGTVDLTVRGTVAEPSVLGRIQITDGSATFAGTKYQLQRGDVYFSNPVRIDPVVDLDATARVENYDITIGVHGTSTSLKPTYRSEPPLTEADIFNLLALGKTQEEAAISNTQQTQAGTDPTTNALLGGALNATVSNRLGKLFGGGNVKIDPAFVGTLGNSGPRITVQQQLSRQLSVTFATSVNSQTQQLIQVSYALSENQSVVATRDETGVFSVVYKLRQRYR